jgi:hypothetical protein
MFLPLTAAGRASYASKSSRFTQRDLRLEADSDWQPSVLR